MVVALTFGYKESANQSFLTQVCDNLPYTMTSLRCVAHTLTVYGFYALCSVFEVAIRVRIRAFYMFCLQYKA